MTNSPKTDFSERQRRARRLYDELGFAVGRIERAALKQWGKRSAGRLLTLAARRVGGVAQLGMALSRFGGRELLGLVAASRQRRLLTHVGERSAAAVDGSTTLGREGVQLLTGIARALLRDPKKNAPLVFGALLGFGAGSGGLDGNGGIPDLDLLAGIGFHRSPLTHTIIAGIVVEGLVLAMADLAADVHGRLPVDHDRVWDDLARVGRPLAEGLATGSSFGLAYHLLVDAFVQPGAYHGLPFEMPMEGHQTVLAANAIAEGTDAAGRARRMSSIEIEQSSEPARSPSQRASAAASNVAASLKTRLLRGNA